jgi:hypothetical protein
MFSRGYWKAFSVRGMPVRLHWTMPIGMFLFGGLGFVPAFWIAFFVLLLVHELGHAVVAIRYGHRVTGIEVTGFGGVCRWSGDASDDERGAIAWGGVVAQAVLAATAHFIITMTGPAETTIGLQLVRAFVTVNIALIAVNLIPLAPLDGAEAWAWIARILRRRRARTDAGRVDVDALLEAIDAPAIEPARPTPRPEPVPIARRRRKKPELRAPLVSTNEELAQLLKSIADEAVEYHKNAS